MPGGSVLRLVAGVAIGAGLAGAAPAAADPIAPAVLVPSLNLYVDALVRAHEAATVCATAGPAAHDEAAWGKAKAVFIATLWANGFPDAFVAGATTRLDAAPAAAPAPDCADPAFYGYFSTTSTGWLADVQRVISALDLTPVAEPVEAAKWSAARNAIAEDLPREAREFECLAVVAPGVLPVVVHAWDEMIVKIGSELVAAGLPHDEIVATLGSAEANALWHPAAAGEIAALQKSCASDQTWSDRLANLGDYAISGVVERLLPAPPSDQ